MMKATYKLNLDFSAAKASAIQNAQEQLKNLIQKAMQAKSLLVDSPCPECPDHAVRSVQVGLDDVEAEKQLRVFSSICGHSWNLPDGEATKIKNAL